MIMETTVTKSAACAFAPGMTFCPPDHELTDRYLQRELAGHPVPGTLGFVHHVDIYSADPEHLVENLAPAPGTGKGDKPPVWYFVSPVRSAGGRKTAGGRKARAVVGGTWHGENRFAVKGSKLGGTVRSFTYTRKSASGERVERLGWLMKEYEVPAQEGGGDRVLCKIYRTPRKCSKSTASSSTTTSSSLSADSGNSKKRNAPGEHPDAPMPSAARTSEENVGHAFMGGSSESEHYAGTASEIYGTTDTQGKDIDDLDELLKLGADTDYQGSEEEIQAMIRELSW